MACNRDIFIFFYLLVRNIHYMKHWKIYQYIINCHLMHSIFDCFFICFSMYLPAEFRNNSVRNLMINRQLISVLTLLSNYEFEINQSTNSPHCVKSHGYLTCSAGNHWFPGDTWSNLAQHVWSGHSNAQAHEDSTVDTNGALWSVIIYISKFSTFPV
jgi:hypothetical protein